MGLPTNEINVRSTTIHNKILVETQSIQSKYKSHKTINKEINNGRKTRDEELKKNCIFTIFTYIHDAIKPIKAFINHCHLDKYVFK